MLTEFRLRNFVLVEDGCLNFSSGLNIISGETGAGKSLLATALGIVLGSNRFLASHIRKDADSATLTAVFDLPEKRLKALEKVLDIDLSAARDEGLIIERRASRESKGRCALNGQTVPVATVREIGETLIDIAAQDEHSALRDPAMQRDFLDRFGKLNKEVTATAQAYRTLHNLVEQLLGGEALHQQRQQELDLITHQCEELAALAPDAQADAELEQQIAFLQNATALQDFCARGVETLYESEGALADTLGSLAQQAESLADCSPEVAGAEEHLRGALDQVEDAVRLMRDCLDKAELDPEAIDELTDRLFTLKELARKHNCEFTELADIHAKLEVRREELGSCLLDSDNLRPAVEAAAVEFRKASEELAAARRKAGKRLATAIKKELAKLGMPHADFAVELESLVEDDAPGEELAKLGSAHGLHEVNYTILPNPGEAWGTLAKTASGGEASRAMLAVKCALAQVVESDVLFFDEMDAGVGGRLGEPIAAQLASLAKKRQVIAITHLPQIASHGDTHLCVHKETTSGRTRTVIRALEDEERVTEIAHMIRGEKASETTHQQAREMLGLA